MTPIVWTSPCDRDRFQSAANLDFYTQVLGLRFVKRTVNFDDPGTYHFYFGDDAGSPGTILTFFPWPGARRGLAGAGEVTHTAFSRAADVDSLLGAAADRDRACWSSTQAFVSLENGGEDVLTFADPDGMKLEIVGHARRSACDRAPRYSDVPVEHSDSRLLRRDDAAAGAAATEETLDDDGLHRRWQRRATGCALHRQRRIGARQPRSTSS